MFQKALAHVMHSSVLFFDTTPIGTSTNLYDCFNHCLTTSGRIISRLSRDQDTIDAELSGNLFIVRDASHSVHLLVAH